ncbi:sugar ABC transporter substrate-binding protein [Paenibacillus sp.]|uniref:ABC transporter substrate-binding protein n=1 Tax=Paenibacillus sp. TaxID=58172 RepID=UPI002D41BB4C|nr:sugar ABC transporter substrate-binding protein [Paenibacillus sp.]HZG83411.1 sugar ABC transporter substrate-binding protein [Paenibacillus sp.]
MKKTWMSLFAIVFSIGTILSACSGGTSSGEAAATEGNGEAPDKQAAEPVTLEFWGRWEEATAQIQETIAEFQTAYPHITVKYTVVPAAQYIAQMQAAISGNDLPDLFAYHPNLPASQLVQMDLLHPISDVVEGKRDAFYEGTWSEGYTTMNGEAYTLPVFNAMRPSWLMYYNKAVLEKAGLTEADVPKSWDQLYEFSKKVKEATNGEAYGLVVGVKALSFLPFAIQQMATSVSPEVSTDSLGYPFNYKTGKYEYNAAGIVEALELFKKLQDEKLLHPNSLVMSFREGTALMEAGQAALTMDGSFFASQMNKDNLDNYGVAPLPTKDGKPAYTGFYGESRASIHVAKSTEHYEEVKLFLQFMMDHLYPKLVKDGIEYSPIKAHNENAEISHPVAAQALKLQSEAYILIPRPFERNLETVKVAAELPPKLPKLTLANIVEGYLSGQIPDVKAALDQLTEEANQAFSETIEKVGVQPSDYVFEDWVPFTPYTK